MTINYPQRYDDDFLNTIKTVIDHVNAHGKTIQDLVADGQLTEEQYSDLITTVNGMIKSGDVDRLDLTPELRSEVDKIRNKIDKGEVSVYDINKNKGKFDQTHLTEELLQQIAGTANINAVPADGSLTTEKYAEKSITYDKTSFSNEISIRLKNIVNNGNFAIDSDGDGLADNWTLFSNASNPRIQDGRQYWDSSSGYGDSGALRASISYPFEQGNLYFIRLNQKNVVRLRFNQLSENTQNILSDGIVETTYMPEQTGESWVSFHTRGSGEAWVSDVLIINLSEAFGFGNEPSVEYAKFLLDTFSSGNWFDDELNLIDATKNGIVTARELKLYDPADNLNANNVNDILIELSEASKESLQVKPGSNLYDPNKNSIGNVANGSVGDLLTTNDDENYVNQALKIDRSQDLTLRGIRSYTFTNVFGRVVQNRQLIDVDSSHTFSANDFPEGAYYIWLTTYPRNADLNAQVVFSDRLPAYERYEKIGGIYLNDEKLFNVPIKNGDAQALHETSVSKLENEQLKEEIETLKENTQSLFNVKMPKTSETKELSLNSSGKQKLILHLHNRENDGYDTTNDVFLPTAESDFSDVKISDDTGNALAYKVINKSDDFDIVADSRLNGREKLENSYGELFGVDRAYIAKSNDQGRTWERVVATDSLHDVNINLVTDDDTLIFNRDEKIYRIEYPYDNYEEVYQLPSGYTNMQVRPKAMVQHPDGEIFFATYQQEHAILIYRSTDDGKTWMKVFEELGTYQHTHGMYIDTHSSPIAIYAGVDRGGGVLKSTDKGETWIDLRENNDFPQATDFGVRYADPSGYRLLTGETAIVGGYSILKTNDDVNFKTVLGTGASIHYFYKMNGKLFACGAGTRPYRHGVVYMSKDEGETWEAVYNTAPLNGSEGANDGFREMTQLDDQLLVGVQGPAYPLRIFPTGSYAEILVDVPDGTNKIFVETGYGYANRKPIHNDSEMNGEHLVKFNLNEGGRVIKESVSGQYFNGDYEWKNGGKHLSYFYPFIISPRDSKSMSIKSLNGYKVKSSNFDVSEGATISFWGQIGYDTNIEIFRTDAGTSVELYNGNRLRVNQDITGNVNRTILPERFIKMDWVINPDGTIKEYVNGQFTTDIPERVEGGLSKILPAIQDSEEMTLLTNLNEADTGGIQHFAIRKGAVSSEQIMKEFNADVSDNVIR